MIGDALLWFQCEETMETMDTWDEIKQKLLLCFGGSSQTTSVYDRLMNLRQTSTVAGHRNFFEEIMAPLTN